MHAEPKSKIRSFVDFFGVPTSCSWRWCFDKWGRIMSKSILEKKPRYVLQSSSLFLCREGQNYPFSCQSDSLLGYKLNKYKLLVFLLVLEARCSSVEQDIYGEVYMFWTSFVGRWTLFDPHFDPLRDTKWVKNWNWSKMDTNIEFLM